MSDRATDIAFVSSGHAEAISTGLQAELDPATAACLVAVGPANTERRFWRVRDDKRLGACAALGKAGRWP
ncbi:MAG: hypothetical protein K2Y56_08070 [Methylobacterium sp.]|uniref:hypothetical protein n=1 Tax=Methylobacterium sp. TaxID=409 RepID=UPI0025EF100C|nr:hypothetical protein [Methylobacterium sp.]MBX9931481.1 hypothetical protein [Methylobacterium sp.]